tara:strand:- start:735 stop:1211 length:477 start_codon:yes stop_codon:yes gene_type:complete
MSRAIDLLITYRVIKLLVTPFEKTQAFKRGIIDKDGKVLRPMKTIKTGTDRKHYTMLHRFVFNLKRILKKAGLGSRLGTFGVALALLIKEDKQYADYKDAIESAVITYLKEQNLYDEILNESRDIPEIDEQPYMTCFGVDIYERGEELISEYDYAKTL